MSKQHTNYSGKVFSELTIINKSEYKTPSNEYLYRCQCSCGNVMFVRYTHLKLGQTTCCGDYINHPKETLIKIGNTYGGFKVLKETDSFILNKRRSRQYVCECILCGKERIFKLQNLLSNPPRSCGCISTVSDEKVISVQNKLNITLLKYGGQTDLAIWSCNIHGYEGSSKQFVHLYKRKTLACPECIQQRYKDNCEKAATKSGYKWLGPAVPTSSTYKTEWECRKGHKWKTTVNEILCGSGCPTCSGRLYINGVCTSKVQIKLCSLLGGLEENLNYKVGKYALDIAFPDKMLCVEYDCDHWHDHEHDTKRDKYIQEQGWRIIRFKSTTGKGLPTKKQIKYSMREIKTNNTVVIRLD